MLSAAFDLSSLREALNQCLPRLGIPAAYLMLQDPAPSIGARVIFAHDPLRDQAVLDAFLEAPIAVALAPEGLLDPARAHALAVEPLFFKADPFGYAIFEMGASQNLVYDAGREQVSGALKVAFLIQELQARAGELQEAY